MFFEEAVRAVAKSHPQLPIAQVLKAVDEQQGGGLPPADPDDSLTLAMWVMDQPEIVEYCQNSQIVHAIKAIRKATNCSLAQAKVAYTIAERMVQE